MNTEGLEDKIMRAGHAVFAALIYIAMCGWLAITVAGWLYTTYLKHFGVAK